MAQQNDPMPFFISQMLVASPLEAPRSPPEAMDPPPLVDGAPPAPFWTSAHCQLILFSEDEENYGPAPSPAAREEEHERSTVIRGMDEEEYRLREEFLKHHRLFTHTSRVCRTIRRFLERTKQKRRQWTPVGTLEVVDDRGEMQTPHHHIDSDYYGDEDSDGSDGELAVELETVRGKASKGNVSLRSRPCTRPHGLRRVRGVGDGVGGGDDDDHDDNDDALDEPLSSQLVSDKCR